MQALVGTTGMHAAAAGQACGVDCQNTRQQFSVVNMMASNWTSWYVQHSKEIS